MNNRPRIKPKWNKYDWLIEIISYVLLIVFWAVTIQYFQHLPDEIPTHYDGAGQTDAYGSKVTIFLLPIIATILFILLSVLAKFPHTFNYPVEITETNAEKQYRNAVWLMRSLKVIIVLIFFFIAYQTIQIALKKAFDLGAWFLPSTFVLLSIFVGFSLYKSKKIKK